MPHEVIMPTLGMAQDTGKLVSWLKQPGDAVSVGDAIMEVETDKAVMEVEALAEGYLVGVRAEAGEDVPVGQVVAIISENADDEVAAAPASKPAPQQATDAQGSESGEVDSLPAGHEIIMPALGMAQNTGLIVSWCKEPGEAVAADDVLLEVETDKSVMEVAAGHDGYVAAILSDAQQSVPVGAVIAIVSDEKPDNPLRRSHVEAGQNEAEAPPAKNDAAVADSASASTHAAPLSAANGQVLASPKMKRLAMEQGLDLALLVQHGVPQPYHVRDLETLKTLQSQQAATAIPLAAPGTGGFILHVSARISASGCEKFLQKLNDEGDVQLDARLLWLRFATLAWREVTEESGSPIIVETREMLEPGPCYQDADRARLSQPVEAGDDAAPSLVLRDFTLAAIQHMTPHLATVPILTIGRDGSDYTISLDYQGSQLGERAAFDFINGFILRLEEPLRYLV